MRIDEFTNRDETGIDFDVVDDAIVFMRNDPVFYRKQYYPAIAKMADMHRDNKSLSDTEKLLGPLVDSAINSYCKKFKVAGKPADIFTVEDRASIIEKICSEELEEINNGAY
tara:strand:- start:52 stop:387 length:336 start_codon:yes stop_codon:yes gene_type:complete